MRLGYRPVAFKPTIEVDEHEEVIVDEVLEGLPDKKFELEVFEPSETLEGVPLVKAT